VARNYSKILVADDICGFDTPANLLMEMICQRLAMDYQLVAGISIAQYEEFFSTSANIGQNNNSSNSGVSVKGLLQAAASKSVTKGGTLAANTSLNTFVNKASTSFKRKENTHVSSVSSVINLDEYKYYILSMGHRIQFMAYDPNLRNISVTLCIAKDTNNLSVERSKKSSFNRFTYYYQLWVPQFLSWKLIAQQCYKFAKEE